jgi:hypothetical protein
MKNNKRLSLADFKVKKIENQNEIDQLMAGAAASCHPTLTMEGCSETRHDADGSYTDLTVISA